MAKELNLSHQTIIEFLEKKGYEVSGLNTPITDEIHDEILKRFAQEKVKADKIAKRREEIAREDKVDEEKVSEAAATVETPEPADVSAEPREEEAEETETVEEEEELEVQAAEPPAQPLEEETARKEEVEERPEPAAETAEGETDESKETEPADAD